jgi:putative membrane protein
MKKQLILLALTVYSFTAFNQTANKSTKSDGGPDREFVKKAANGGMMEVELGKYAQQTATSKRVKDFGAMMERDHSKANEELKGLAKKKGIDIPASMDPSTRNHVDKMKLNTGEGFEKAYIDMMVNDHMKDIGEFERAEKNVKDDALRAFISKTLPTLRMHLDSARAIKSVMK